MKGPDVLAQLPRAATAWGVLGSTMVAVGACAHVTVQTRPWGWWPVDGVAAALRWQAGATLIVLGFLALSWAWWLLRPRAHPTFPRWLVLTLWSLPLLLIPPVMSADPFLYADLGYILAKGRNPYLVRLGGLGGPYAPQIDPFWSGHGVAYPPLALEVSTWLVRATGIDPYWGVIAQRVPGLVGAALLVGLLPRVAARLGVSPALAVWVGALNPIAIVHLIGGAHYDGLMAGLVVLALWLATHRWRISTGLILGPIMLGLAMGIKQQAGLAVIAVSTLAVLDRLRDLPPARRAVLWLSRVALASAVAIGTFAITSWATGLGWGWVQWLPEMGRARTLTFGVVFADLFLWTGINLTTQASLVVGAVAALALVWLLITRMDAPLLQAAGGSLLLLFVSQALHPWYLGLALALIALLPLDERVVRWITWSTIGYGLCYAVQFCFLLLNPVAIPIGLALTFLLWRLAGADRSVSLG